MLLSRSAACTIILYNSKVGIQTMELLAPAGSPDSLVAAVRSGADAVYLGGSAFSARASAKNFDDDALREAVEYCHARGVKVYLALNTLLRQEELSAAVELSRYAASLPIDGMIVQDLGLVSLLQERAPKLRLNASTQMSVTNPAGARLLAKNGFPRVVVARELSLEQIREIKEGTLNTPIEIESFVHGALCMSVSGQCYFSSVLGSRSGNRGMCAQPCRLPFSVPGGTGNDLSLRDLSMISRISELEEAGVTSAKIEGRMKRPEYVAAATAACRYSADGKPIPAELTENLSAVFSRSGFTTGYPDGELGRSMFGIRSKEDVTGATKEVFAKLHALYKDEFARVPVSLGLLVHAGKPVTLTATDDEGHSAEALGECPEPALNRPIDEERCRTQLEKMGGTPFFAKQIACDIEPGLSMPISMLNRLRRDVLEQLLTMRSKHSPVPFTKLPIPEKEPHRPAKTLRLRASFRRVEDIPELAKQCELVYLPAMLPSKQFEDLLSRGFPVAASLPRGIFGTEKKLKERLNALKSMGVRDVWAGTLGGVGLALESGLKVHGGFSLNAMNTPALQWLQHQGLEDTELSFELSLSQAAALGGDLPRGLVVYGRQPLMLCRNCPGKNGSQSCAECGGNAWLTDRRGIRFPVMCDGDASEVLNSVPLYLADRMREVRGQDFGVLRFTVENSVEIEEIFRNYLGLRAVENTKRDKEQQPFTRGLYYRGIE